MTAPAPLPASDRSPQAGDAADTRHGRPIYVYWGIAFTLLLAVAVVASSWPSIRFKYHLRRLRRPCIGPDVGKNAGRGYPCPHCDSRGALMKMDAEWTREYFFVLLQDGSEDAEIRVIALRALGRDLNPGSTVSAHRQELLIDTCGDILWDRGEHPEVRNIASIVLVNTLSPVIPPSPVSAYCRAELRRANSSLKQIAMDKNEALHLRLTAADILERTGENMTHWYITLLRKDDVHFMIKGSVFSRLRSKAGTQVDLGFGHPTPQLWGDSKRAAKWADMLKKWFAENTKGSLK
jgi:hypothetical protein